MASKDLERQPFCSFKKGGEESWPEEISLLLLTSRRLGSLNQKKKSKKVGKIEI